ncbi:MAG: right-handed parallel beta-helix repeat-containing protein, partial [Thermoplasmata archaeon]|nr:right-handed parallel beta-helix repeat-containing protein [Thermoplasmata archaeon]
ADSTGGGIYCFNYAHPMVLYNIIGSNTAVWGGGICCQTGCSPTITGNTVISNTAIYSGGGIGCYNSSSPTIECNLISENVSNRGGGIYCYQNCSPIIKRNVINLNTAANYGAAVYVTGNSSPQIDSCTIAHNNYDGIHCYDGSNPTISYCNIYGHTNSGVWNDDPNFTINAENCWWGHETGPWHPTANPGGQGDPVSDHVDFDPWLLDSVQGIGIEELEIATPSILKLQVSPNPFRHFTDIRYQITNNCNNVVLKVYDIAGRQVKDLTGQLSVIGHQSSVLWDGTDQLNRRLASGVYFVTLQTGDYSTTEKVLIIR